MGTAKSSEGESLGGGGGNYAPCFIQCQKVLWSSIYYFIKRILSYFWLRVQNCWTETYKECAKIESGFWGWIKKVFCVIWRTIVSIVCTFLYVLITILSFAIFPIVFVFAFIRCFFVPCSLKQAPVVTGCDNLASSLRNNVNDKLSWFQSSTGFFGTPFKETGLANSWDKYDLWIDISGMIEQVSDSSDGLKTVDMRLNSISLFDNDRYEGVKCGLQFNANTSKFLRSEIFPHVLLGYTGKTITVGDSIQIKGRLCWDRDGWLEIHPEKGSDLKVV